jgi:hypothetical protein
MEEVIANIVVTFRRVVARCDGATRIGVSLLLSSAISVPTDVNCCRGDMSGSWLDAKWERGKSLEGYIP